MFKMTAKIVQIKLDPVKWSKAVDTSLQTLVRNAAREWLRAMVIAVPVYSGFALGSVKNAQGPGGNLSRFLNVSVPIAPVKNAPKWYYHHGPGSNRIPKTADNAGQFAWYNFTSGNHVYRFFFRSDVFHLVINAFFNRSPVAGSAKQALKYSAKAYGHYINNNLLTRAPKVKSFMQKIYINGGLI